MVIFMRKNIKDLNGDLNPENVKCRRCPARREEDGGLSRQGGGFSPSHGILLCANEMRDKKHVEDTLSHEMVHAWDHLRWKVDWADLRHAACSEVNSAQKLKMEIANLKRFELRALVESAGGRGSSSRETTGP
jgi:inner membrane protease ATP23